MKNMLTILSEKPLIGASAGFASSLLVTSKEFLTDEGILQIVQISGIWIGFMIALLTGMIKLLELFRAVRRKV